MIDIDSDIIFLLMLPFTTAVAQLYLCSGTEKPCTNRGLHVGSFYCVCMQCSVLGLYFVSYCYAIVRLKLYSRKHAADMLKYLNQDANFES